MKAGATPKLIMSVNESNSFPTFDVPLINLAILPSSPSIIAANMIAITANSNLPSKANLIEDKPIQTPIKVSIFGKITLALFFLSVTSFKLFFGLLLVYPFNVISISAIIYLSMLPISFFHYRNLKKQNEDQNLKDDEEDLEDIL